MGDLKFDSKDYLRKMEQKLISLNEENECYNDDIIELKKNFSILYDLIEIKCNETKNKIEFIVNNLIFDKKKDSWFNKNKYYLLLFLLLLNLLLIIIFIIMYYSGR